MNAEKAQTPEPSKTADLDDDIRALRAMLTEEPALKFRERMQVYARLEKLYQLRLKFGGTGRGGAFK